MRRGLRACVASSLILLSLITACWPSKEPTPSQALPEPMALPENAVVLYWVTEAGPPARDEGVILYADGLVTYINRIEQREGSQYVTPEGVRHFLDLLQAHDFDRLQGTYSSPRGGAPPSSGTLSARISGRMKRVQWEFSAPPALKEVVTELEQFLEVVRTSAD